MGQSRGKAFLGLLDSHFHTFTMVAFLYSLLMGSALGAPNLPEVPSLTPQVQEATGEFLAKFESAASGGLAALAPKNTDRQAPQIGLAYMKETPEVAEARAKHSEAVATAEAGGLHKLQRSQVVHSYLEDTEPVSEAKAKHLEAVASVESGGLQATQPTQVVHSYLEDTEPVAEARAKHLEAVASVESGGLQTLQPIQVAPAYLEDTLPVLQAKAQFRAAFKKATEVTRVEKVGSKTPKLSDPVSLQAPPVLAQPQVGSGPISMYGGVLMAWPQTPRGPLIVVGSPSRLYSLLLPLPTPSNAATLKDMEPSNAALTNRLEGSISVETA